jgi:3-oxoacid CoA-transferase subunit A
LPGLDQSTVDVSTEQWLDEIEAVADYDAWLCGHWHINKSIDKLRFVFESFISAEYLLQEKQGRERIEK